MQADKCEDCTAHNLSVKDIRELRSIVQQVVDSDGEQAADLFPRFNQIVRKGEPTRA